MSRSLLYTAAGRRAMGPREKAGHSDIQDPAPGQRPESDDDIRTERTGKGTRSRDVAVLIVGIAAVVVAFVGLETVRSSSGGSIASDFPVTLYQGEEELGRADLRFADFLAEGKPIVLNFWGGYCPPCRAEIPDIQRVYERYHGEVLFLGLDVGPFTGLGTTRSARALLVALNITYPAGTPQDRDPLIAYKIMDLPTTVFFDARGKIFRRWVGSIDEYQLNAVVSEMLGDSRK